MQSRGGDPRIGATDSQLQRGCACSMGMLPHRQDSSSHCTFRRQLAMANRMEMADREMRAMRQAVEFSMAARESIQGRLDERQSTIDEQSRVTTHDRPSLALLL